jgi:phage tail sheath protein FI
MPEYLSPGVFIEEIPSGLRAIEGVSTSTAAFVGPASRGPVPGYQWPSSATPSLPFQPAGGFVLAIDPSPVLVTSFAEFQRTFGPPLKLAATGDPDYGFLGHSVKAFFDNGGKRAFIARVVDPTTATPSQFSLAQGVAYRLVRSASKTDNTLYLTSTRGLDLNQAVTLKRHSDGQNALGTPNLGAIAGGAKPPFALHDGDSIKVTVAGGANVTGKWNAAPASARSVAGTATFPAALIGSTLQITVGGPSAPVQNITFNAGDAVTPLTAAAPTLAEVTAYIARFASGAHVYADASTTQLVIETDTAGLGSKLDVAGSALAHLALSPTSSSGSGNVADIGHVTIAEIAAQLALADITVDADGTGALRISTVATGTAATLKLDEQPAGSGALNRLGYGSGATMSATGSNGVSPTLSITGYDSQSNSITFGSAFGRALDAADVYVLGPTPPTAAAGPTFIARSPGSWSANVSVQVSNADRQPVGIAGSVATGGTVIPVQNASSFYVGGTIEIDHGGQGRSVHQITGINPGTRQLTINPGLPAPALAVPSTPPPTARTLEIDITVVDETGAAPIETYKGMAWAQGGSASVRRHYAWTINARSRLVWVQPPAAASEDFTLQHQPATADGFSVKAAGGSIGVDGWPSLPDHWVGVDNGPGQRSGIESLKDLTEARIIAAPGNTDPTVQLALIAQCELLRYRFAILDGERDPVGGSLTSILVHRNLYDSSFAAYYLPWVTVTLEGQTRQLPASGYLAGIYARVDNTRGVWKAPANEPVLNVSGLKTYFTTGEQDLLNPRGVNLIRQFDIGGIRVWGARTLSSDPDVKYINVRRTLIFLEASIDRGTQWVVFEPNDSTTWARVTESVGAFLLTQWRNGALFGRSPERAFYVRCDESTMTSDDILNGRLVCEIGVAIVRPAEFVIFRIQQITNFATAS